ncbi:hypothetical protein GCM10028818_40760 [Spirosoma horti]
MATTITIDDEIKELQRELNVRRRVYPDWSKGPNPKLKPAEAERRISVMERTLERLKTEKGRAVGEQGKLF